MKSFTKHRAGMGAASALALMIALTSCADSSAPEGGAPSPESPAEEATAENPFGLAEDAPLEAVVFDGGYGTEYVSFAADLLKERFPGVEVTVSPSGAIGQELQPRFVAGDPPDLFSNDGAGSIPTDTIIDQLEALDDVWNAENLDGVKISEAVFPNVRDDGTYEGADRSTPETGNRRFLALSGPLVSVEGVGLR